MSALGFLATFCGLAMCLISLHMDKWSNIEHDPLYPAQWVDGDFGLYHYSFEIQNVTAYNATTKSIQTVNLTRSGTMNRRGEDTLCSNEDYNLDVAHAGPENSCDEMVDACADASTLGIAGAVLGGFGVLWAAASTYTLDFHKAQHDRDEADKSCWRFCPRISTGGIIFSTIAAVLVWAACWSYGSERPEDASFFLARAMQNVTFNTTCTVGPYTSRNATAAMPVGSLGAVCAGISEQMLLPANCSANCSVPVALTDSTQSLHCFLLLTEADASDSNSTNSSMNNHTNNSTNSSMTNDNLRRTISNNSNSTNSSMITNRTISNNSNSTNRTISPATDNHTLAVCTLLAPQLHLDSLDNSTAWYLMVGAGLVWLGAAALLTLARFYRQFLNPLKMRNSLSKPLVGQEMWQEGVYDDDVQNFSYMPQRSAEDTVGSEIEADYYKGDDGQQYQQLL